MFKRSYLHAPPEIYISASLLLMPVGFFLFILFKKNVLLLVLFPFSALHLVSVPGCRKSITGNNFPLLDLAL